MAKFTSDPQIFPGDIRTDTSMQQFNLGDKAVTPDGRAYRYVRCDPDTALVAGKLYDGPVDIADHTNLTCTAGSIGDLTITVTLGATAVTTGQYSGGVIVINDVTGQGFTYTIKDHPAADASAALVVTLDDEETVVTAVDATSQATLVLNQYNGVIIHAVTEVAIPVGVAVTQVTKAQYGWIQTRGPVSLMNDASKAGIGESVAASTTTEGNGTKGDGALCPIGYQLAAGVSGEYNPVFLTID